MKAAPILLTIQLLLLLISPPTVQAGVEVVIRPQPLSQGAAAAVIVGGLPENHGITGKFDRKPIFFLADGDRMIGLFGVDMDLEPGSHDLTLSWSEADRPRRVKIMPLNIRNRNFGTRSLQFETTASEVMEENKVEVEIQKAEADRALGTLTEARLWDGPFRMPTEGSVISEFGLKTIVNGKPRKMPHLGVDLRGGTGLPVKAPAAGRVLLADSHFLTGGSIYLDHGQGWITVYYHLSKINVQAGDQVQAGDEIGLVGATGLVTGPHLHYGLFWCRAAIDPLLFHQLLEQVLKPQEPPEESQLPPAEPEEPGQESSEPLLDPAVLEEEPEEPLLEPENLGEAPQEPSELPDEESF